MVAKGGAVGEKCGSGQLEADVLTSWMSRADLSFVTLKKSF